MNAIPTVAPADLARLLDGRHAPVVLAVTTEAEHGRRRIPGSRRFTDLDALRRTIAPTRHIVLTGCAPDDLTCAWAYRLLSESGFRGVRVLAGGLGAWVALGLPIERDHARAPATTPTPDPHA